MNFNMDFDDIYYKTICRVCLSCSKQENMVSLINSEENGELTCYGVAVTTFANIVINSDSLPNMMCQRCLFLLKQAITFKKTCENSDETLMRLVQNSQDSADETKEKITQYVMFLNYFADADSSDCDESETIQNSMVKSEESANECEQVIKTEDVVIEITLDDSPDQDDSSLDNNLDSFQDKRVIVNEKKNKSITDLRPEEIKEDILLTELENMLKLDSKIINSQLKRYPTKPKSKPSIQKRTTLIRPGKSRKCIKKQCEVCNKVLGSVDSYRSHMKRSHIDGHRFMCEQCGKSFGTKDQVNRHQAGIHNNYERATFYKCKQCDYKAFHPLGLEEHERIHSGELPFTCDKCGRRFRRRYLWWKHMKHHEEKTIPCPKCPLKFYLTSEMHKHYNNVHERWYAYGCHVCDLTYSQTDTVRQHLVDKHGIDKEKQGKIKRIVIGTKPNIATCE